jgi:hypothetical protein
MNPSGLIFIGIAISAHILFITLISTVCCILYTTGLTPKRPTCVCFLFLIFNIPSDLVPDLGPDLVLDLAPDLGPDLVRDLAPNLVPDLDRDLVPDLVPDLARDLDPDLVRDLAPDLFAFNLHPTDPL